ncbi:MAG: glycoside hydrolase family 31 protein [Bacteroidota bacterium]|nr:glycoside hydrolase family 31 protein [Bacteroidota bacterium]
MQKTVSLLVFIILVAGQMLGQQYSKTGSGITASLQSMTVEVKFYSPEIVRVTKTPDGNSFTRQSLSVIKTPEKTPLKIEGNGSVVILSSKALSVTIDLKTGKIAYNDAQGNPLLSEKEYGAQFTPVKDVQKEAFLARQAFLLDKNEAIYGLGQQQNGKLIQRNERIVLKNDNMKICIPYFMSAKGYGLFWDNYAATTYTDNAQETSFESLGDGADYYFMYGGNGDGVIARMRELTGQAPMLPLWTYGYWQSRERYKTQQELVGVVEKYRSIGVPLDGIIQDWQYWGRDSVWNAMSFDSKTYPDPQGMTDKIHAMNAHLMIVAWPGFGPLTKQYKELSAKKMMINFDTWPPKSGAKPYDPYNPTARDIYWDYLNKGVFSFNTDAWWLDSSEPDHINVKEEDFDQPTYLGSYRSVVNAFPLEHVGGVYDHQRATTSDKRVCILTRSAFAGQQRYGANSWSGDIVAGWETLQKQIPAALNFSSCGIPYWNADIGGFFLWNYGGEKALENNAYRELYVRWIQFGAFTPMMRSHGTDAPKEIFRFGKRGDRDFDAIEKYINLRYSLLPYLYSTAWNVSNNAGSIMRPLFFDFVNDKAVPDINDEYLFGKSILVAPVVNPMYVSSQDGKGTEDYSQAKSRKVYLPAGSQWFDFWTGEKLDGGQSLEKAAPIDILPLYIKAGSVIPFGPKVQYATEKKWNNLEIRIYPGADGEFVLYEDENDNYNYEKGAYSTISFHWNDKSRVLTISERNGHFAGMLEKRSFILNMAGKDKKAVKKVSYSGKKMFVKF